jgi:TPR repeat protein
MTRIILLAVLCLTTHISANADALPMTAHELAETRLLAEWVGVAHKQNVLGDVYYEGEGVPQDYGEALKWYLLAADQGLAESQHMLGIMYDQGNGMPQDYVKAVSWYRKAADQAYAPAQFELGNNYADGEGVPQNFAEAYVWYSLAASAGLEQARELRDTSANKLSKEDIALAQKRSTQLFETFQQSKTEE